MNFKQLKTFLLVADMKSLSRAAIASDTAQSLVSRQIAMLEDEWGRRLFDRTGRGMSLSESSAIRQACHRGRVGLLGDGLVGNNRQVPEGVG